MITAAFVMVLFALFLVAVVFGLPALGALMAMLFTEVATMLIVGWPFWVILILVVCLFKKGGK